MNRKDPTTMKIQLTFKTPDVLEDLSEGDRGVAKAVIAKYVEYDEYVTIELDTETGEATVLPVEK